VQRDALGAGLARSEQDLSATYREREGAQRSPLHERPSFYLFSFHGGAFPNKPR
jgi:hypothetical protein